MPRYDLPRAADGPLRLVQLFVNSVDREHGREWLPTPQALTRWFDERGLSADAPVTAGDLERAHALRESLRTLLRANNDGRVDPDAVATVNGAARRGGLELALAADGRAAIAVRGRGADAALARIVAVVFDAMLDGSWARLKACRHCEWVFWDTSKNRSGSWCSMQLCGNRTKTRAYRRRRSVESTS
jgi:predicted RNA-binding Zn ribbon-like protein